MKDVTNYFILRSAPGLKMSPDGDFFRSWVDFTHPFHKLESREMDLLAAFLKKRYELSKVILDTNLLDRALMDRKTKLEIRNSCKMSAKHFGVILCKFRKKGILIRDNITNLDRFFLNLIPSVTDDGVGLMIYFDFKNEHSNKSNSKAGIQES